MRRNSNPAENQRQQRNELEWKTRHERRKGKNQRNQRETTFNRRNVVSATRSKPANPNAEQPTINRSFHKRPNGETNPTNVL